jgi:hypothetical protein
MEISQSYPPLTHQGGSTSWNNGKGLAAVEGGRGEECWDNVHKKKKLGNQE